MRIRQWITVLGLAIVLGLAHLPPSAAQPLCLGDTVWNAEEEACVAVESETPTVEPTAAQPEPTDEPIDPTTTVDPTDDDDALTVAVYTLSLTAFTCPQPLAAGLPFEEATAGCAYVDPATSPFGYHVYADQEYFGVVVSGSGGSTYFETVPAGDLRVDASYTDAWAAPYAYCAYDDAWSEQVPTIDGVIEFDDVLADVNVSCTFYFAPRATVPVALVVEFCPATVATGNLVDYFDLKAACQEPLQPVDVTIESGEPTVQGTTVNGSLAFEAVGTGEIAIAADVPGGYAEPWYFCMVSGPEGQTIQQADLRLPDADGALRIANLRYGEAVICDLFFTQEVVDDDGSVDAMASPDVDSVDTIASPEATPGGLGLTEDDMAALSGNGETVYVGIVNRFCSLEARTDLAIRDLDATCPVSIDGPLAEFTVETIRADGTATGVYTRTTHDVATVGANQLSFSGIPVGTFRIRQQPIPGYQNAVVACQVYLDGVFVVPMRVMDASSGSITIDNLAAGSLLTCAFYQAEDLSTVRVDVIAYACPASAAPLTDYVALNAVCGSPASEIEIQVQSSQGVATGPTFGGLASFEDVGQGEIAVREFIPAGYGYPRVYCLVMGEAGQTIKSQDLEIMNGGGFVYVGNVPPRSSVLCEIFNLPGETPDQGDDVPRTWLQPMDAMIWPQ